MPGQFRERSHQLKNATELCRGGGGGKTASLGTCRRFAPRPPSLLPYFPRKNVFRCGFRDFPTTGRRGRKGGEKSAVKNGVACVQALSHPPLLYDAKKTRQGYGRKGSRLPIISTQAGLEGREKLLRFPHYFSGLGKERKTFSFSHILNTKIDTCVSVLHAKAKEGHFSFSTLLSRHMMSENAVVVRMRVHVSEKETTVFFEFCSVSLTHTVYITPYLAQKRRCKKRLPFSFRLRKGKLS